MTTIKTAAQFPIRLVESGPAGGAILAAQLAAASAYDKVLSFDMGGTTAKLCLIDDYSPQSARKFEIGRAARFIRGSGMPVRIPVVEMIEIGTGGGSIAWVDKLGRLSVGPQSAGSEPGPAAFAKGGTQPTVTDADVVLGLIDPTGFAEGRVAIDVGAANAALQKIIGDELNTDATGAALGVSQIVDESMASAGRMHAVESGRDLGDRIMIAFGGNGPLHATRVARGTGINRILIPCDPSVGSAIGFLHAPVSFEVVCSRYITLEDLNVDAINNLFDSMITESEIVVRAGTQDAELITQRIAFMRYHGQGHEIEVSLADRDMTTRDIPGLKKAFEAEYRNQFARVVPGMTIEILNWAVKVSTQCITSSTVTSKVPPRSCKSGQYRTVICDLSGEEIEIPVFHRKNLKPGDQLNGPALIVEPQTTTLVSRDFDARIKNDLNILLVRDNTEAIS